MKKVWLINGDAMPPSIEPRMQTIKLAHYLGLLGFDVTIFASSILHNMDINLIKDGAPYLEKRYGDIHFVHINSHMYHKNDFHRVWSWILFRYRLKKYAYHFPKPDVVVQGGSVLFGFMSKRFFKHSMKAKYIVQVLDLQPESLVEVNILSANNPIIHIMRFCEKQFYKGADELVFSMEGAKDYIIEHKWNKEQGGPIDLKKVHYINNGVDLRDFDENKVKYIIDDDDLKNPLTNKVIYIGSIRYANNVFQLILAAEQLQKRKDIVFIIYGNGEERTLIQEYCISHNLSNVIIKDKWVEPKYVPYIVSQARVNILNYHPGGFGHYGGSQSKMFQYMASGKPICCNIKMDYCPINQYNLGIADNFSSSIEYSEAIKYLVDLPEPEYSLMCERSRIAATNFDYKYLASLFSQLL